MNTTQPRQPAGSPQGGQFATTPGGAEATLDLPNPTNQSTIGADGNIHGTFTTTGLNMSLPHDRPLGLPEGNPFGQVTDTVIDYNDFGRVMTVFHTTNGTEVVVEHDSEDDVDIFITTPDGNESAYRTWGKQWGDPVEGAEHLVTYGLNLHARVVQIESAVRWAALEASRDNILAIVTQENER